MLFPKIGPWDGLIVPTPPGRLTGIKDLEFPGAASRYSQRKLLLCHTEATGCSLSLPEQTQEPSVSPERSSFRPYPQRMSQTCLYGKLSQKHLHRCHFPAT
ncbi:hypothetical protein XENTR_v10004141 [Xenopus tropicalis]|nr:hypothetical protein XENTR_v10004141 [Xenopus tropicalis]